MEATKRLIEKLSLLVDKEKYGTALDIYEQSARSHLYSSTSKNDRYKLFMLGAKIYYFNQLYETSQECLSALQKHYENVGSNIDFVLFKFQILSITGKNTEALEFIKKAISIGWPQDDHHALNFYLGKAYFWKGEYFEANHCFQQCYRYYLSTTDQYMLGSVLYMLGYTAFQRSFFDIAGSFYEKALEHFKSTEKNNQVGGTYHMLGILAYRTGRYADATEHLRLAKIHFQKCESQTGVIESDIASARVSIYLEEYEDAERLLLKSYRESKAIDYKRGVALSAEFLGEIHYHRADYAKSLQYLEIAEELAVEIAPSGDIAVELYRRLGDLFIACDGIERAEECLSKALDIGEHLNDRYELGSIYRAYGLLFARKNNIDRARSFFMESTVALQVIKERYELARTYITAAATYKQCCRANNLPEEYRNELLRDADTYEVEAMHLYQSLGLEHKVREVEVRRRGSEKIFTRKDGAQFIQLRVDDSWLYRRNIVARSSQMRDVIRKVEHLAPSNIPVLITGETGTGKEVVARLLHQLSDRSKGLFVAVNCASVPDTVFESELFGHKKGAFTGAIRDKIGLMEQASGGTLFLDEISELSSQQQAKLLRALQEGMIRRLGDTIERQVDVRLISASNQSVHALINSGKLRQDFYYRISIDKIELQPLRNRKDDIPALFAYYISRYADGVDVEEGVLELLGSYHWPGNVRELVGIAKVLAHLAKQSGIIHVCDLPIRIRDFANSEPKPGTHSFAKGRIGYKLLSADYCSEAPESIRQLILSSLRKHHGNKSAVARDLSISRCTLYRRIKELGILKE